MPSASPNDYSMLLNTVGYSKFVERAIYVEEILRADGEVAQASRVRRALQRLEVDLNEAAKTVARMARVEIRRAERQSRVRPDTGGVGGKRLANFIGVSLPVPRLPGTVFVNDEKLLEENVPWWWTNEEGYSGHIGRKFIGAFYESGWRSPTAPNPQDGGGRTHPLLQIGKGPNTGKGTIKEPIPERRFVERGAAVAAVEWHRLVRAAKERFMAEVTAATRAPRRRSAAPSR